MLAISNRVCYTKRMNTKEKKEALALLGTLYAGAKPALEYSTAYELLVAVMLSAQCTDARVNIVTRELFKKHNTPETMLTLSQSELERYIFSCGFYRNKAAHILSATQDIVERFGGEVPSTIEELMSLAGVGKKTANVVYSVWFGGAAIAVDTHVFRVSNRLGLAKGSTPEKVEAGLMKVVPQEDWGKAHHWLIYHGRQICHSQKPECEACALAGLCDERKKSSTR